jgi:multidrug efflux system outer membrane protein
VIRFLLPALAMLAGCTLDPFYQRPAAPVAATYPAGAAYPNAPGHGPSADLIGWQDFFTDRRLQTLIGIALANNRDLRVAVLNIAESQAQYRVQRADIFPTISLTAAPEYEGLPNSTNIPSPTSTTTPTAGTATGTTQSITQTGSSGGTYRYYSANLGFTSFELDVFGRLRSLTRQAFESYLSQIEQRRSTQISLVAEVASDYLTYLADQDLLRLTQETLASEADSVRLTKLMLAAGTTTLLSVRQAEQLLATASANLAQYTRQVAQDENALTLLLGEPLPADLPQGQSMADQGLIADLPAGLPSDLLARRPDIAAAEHTLLGANANIGAARAAFFPSITLTASDGVASNQFNHLFTGAATTWLFSPQINLPIFTWGKNEGNLDAAKVQKDIYVADYEKAIQTAFREVADALAARGTYGGQLASEQALVDAASDSYRLAQMRFRSGVDSFLTTLDSQRTLYSAQQTLVTIRQAQQTSLVTLYKVLGGGWNARTISVADDK